MHRVIAGIERVTGQFETSRKSYDIAIGGYPNYVTRIHRRSNTSAGLRRRTKSGGSLFLMNGKSLEAERDLQKAIVESERFLTQPMKSGLIACSKSAALIDLAEIQILKKDGGSRPKIVRSSRGSSRTAR